MTKKNFIQKAIEGGVDAGARVALEDTPLGRAVLCRVLLDPLAWKAVGKVEGWKPDEECTVGCSQKIHFGEWCDHFSNMPGHLARGKTIEQFLETL